MSGCAEKIKGSYGAREFKAYMEEIESIRPTLMRWRELESFPHQHLLFAVDPGSGCTTALNLLHDYLHSAGIYKKSLEESTHSIRELTFSYSENISVDMRAVLSELKDDIRYANPGLVGIHIEQWLK